MTDLAVNDVLSAEAERRPQRGNLKPWPKGTSGNPGGLLQNGKRYQTLHGKLKAELGGELTAIEDALLDKAVTLLLRRPRSDDAAVKLASEARRILDRLQHCSKPATTVPLRERLAAEVAAEDAA